MVIDGHDITTIQVLLKIFSFLHTPQFWKDCTEPW